MRPISTTRSVRDGFGGDLTLNFQIKSNLRDAFAGQADFICGKNHGRAMWYESELRNSTKIKFIPYFGGELATAATAGQIAVDGGGDQQREAAGSERTIRRPKKAEQVTRGRRVSEKFPKFDPSVYIT